MKMLLTGASGFVGSILLPLLCKEYDVTTLGRGMVNDIALDLTVNVPTLPDSFDIVLHAAGKTYVRHRSKNEWQEFYDVNVQGTKNLCRALERSGVPERFVFLSSVAVYGCVEGEDVTEEAPLNGTHPYAQSKIIAERYLSEWCTVHGVALTILRPALIAGPNPVGNLGAMIRGLKRGFYFRVGNGETRKSVVMAQDIVTLVRLTSEKPGIYNVTDGRHPSLAELEDVICRQMGRNGPLSVPLWFARILARCGDMAGSRVPINSLKLEKLTKTLTYSNKKAVELLGWKPVDVLNSFKLFTEC